MLLRNKDKQTLCRLFAQMGTPIEVWAYGSRVNGDAHEGSDIDLVIRTQNLQPLPLPIFIDLKEQITESNIPILVDLHDWARLPPSFHKNILENHEILYSSLAEKNKDE